MADFMTVLAASQKQVPTAAHGKVLAELLPEGLFENVLSEQIGAKLNGESLALPLMLSEGFTMPSKATAKKLPAAVIDMDKPVDTPVAPSLAPLAVAHAKDSGKQTAAGEAAGAAGARPILSRIVLESAASSAAPVAPGGQDLPLDESRLSVTAGAVAALSGTTDTLSSRVDVSSMAEGVKPLDQSSVAAARQTGQLELVARTPETRTQAMVEAPLRSQQFPVEFSEKVVWLIGRQSQVAELSLNPPQLGALEVRLSLSGGGEAGAQFYSPNPVVREAIEAALPRLRELLAQAGIALGDAQVREEAFARHEANGSANGGSGRGDDGEDVSPAAMGMRAVHAGLGLVDLYV